MKISGHLGFSVVGVIRNRTIEPSWTVVDSLKPDSIRSVISQMQPLQDEVSEDDRYSVRALVCGATHAFAVVGDGLLFAAGNAADGVCVLCVHFPCPASDSGVVFGLNIKSVPCVLLFHRPTWI